MYKTLAAILSFDENPEERHEETWPWANVHCMHLVCTKFCNLPGLILVNDFVANNSSDARLTSSMGQ